MHDGSCPKCGAASEGKSCGSCGAQTSSSRRSPSPTNSQRHRFLLSQLDGQLPLRNLTRPPRQQEQRKRHRQQKGFTGFIGRQAGSYVYLANVRKSIHEENKRKGGGRRRN
ncbi:hypothetical protein QC764_307070 [Podospora pseudoanserina]|uniref:Uncharacterized protein n=1 Tax=Podospora pseudoanserina TaxID=2609844 RepID=A0ABR0IDU6_9PEZI|nr:hypothetical protein QC764_307070 [Podospora pseudoanserina]